MPKFDKRNGRKLSRPASKRPRLDGTPMSQPTFSDNEGSNDSLSVTYLDEDFDNASRDSYSSEEEYFKRDSKGKPLNSNDLDEFSAFDFRSLLKLRLDQASRPIWVTPAAHVYMETFNPISNLAQDFLIAIAEPVCRPEHIHEYRLTSYSLYAAVSVGLRTSEIIGCLRRLCKTDLPQSIIDYIRSCTLSYGKAKLVLRGGHFYVESNQRAFLKTLIGDKEIRECLLNIPTAEGLSEVTMHKFESSDAILALGIESKNSSKNPDVTSTGQSLDANQIESDGGLKDILKLYADIDAEEEEQEQAEAAAESKDDYVDAGKLSKICQAISVYLYAILQTLRLRV